MRRRQIALVYIGILLFLFIALSTQAFATSYYIDYQSGSDANSGTSKAAPWKHHPYMKGFIGNYIHASGDTFVFKGGVSWTYSSEDPIFPINIKVGGEPGIPDRYTIDNTWYSGSSWTPPIFDGGQRYGGNTTTLGRDSWIFGDNQVLISNIIIDGFNIQNVGNPADASGTAIQFLGGGSSIEIKNCTLNPFSIQAFAYSNSRGTSNHIYIHDNKIMNAGRGVVYGDKGAVTNDVRVYGNTWQGPGSAFGAYHLDGLMVGCPTGCTDTDPATVTDIIFYGNLFYGSWVSGATALYYSNGHTDRTAIYNNVFALENSSCPTGGCLSPAFVDFGNYDSNITIYNNTFSADSNPGYGQGANNGVALYNSSGSLTIKNNIFSGVGNSILSSNPPSSYSSVTIDNNLHNPAPSSGGSYGNWVWFFGSGGYNCKTLSSCRSNGVEANGTGNETYSKTYAGFTAIPDGSAGSGNWQLQLSSPAIGAGANLSSDFSTDLLGSSRPSSEPWDIGAYAYAKKTLAPPSGLRATQ